MLWIEKAVHKCYKEEDGDKFLSESTCSHDGEDYERLLAARDADISSPGEI